jgi:argininosuccinate lyase
LPVINSSGAAGNHKTYYHFPKNGGDDNMRERLKAQPSPLLAKYIALPALQEDAQRNFYNMMNINLAHALMLNKQGIIPREHTKKLLEGMLDLIEKGPGVLPMKAEYEDLFYNIEQYLIAQLGMETAGKLHTARSRNDLGVTVIRMAVRESILGIYPLLLQLRKTILEMAKEYGDTILTGYTHMQPAQPITLGYYLCAVDEALERDFQRITEAYKRLNLCAMGGCAFAGTGFPVDRQYMSEVLGFDAPMENNMDAIAGRDFLLEMASDLAIMGSTINRFAHDLYYWGTNEFGYLEVDNTFANSSSIMPQKKNPTVLEQVKAKTGLLLGDFLSIATILKGIPFGHCKDMIETLSPFWNAMENTECALALLNGALSTIHIHKEGMKDRADSNYCTVTELSDELVKTEGLSFRVAYQIVGSIVGDCVDAGLSCKDITTKMLDEAGMAFAGRTFGWPQERVSKVLDSAYSVGKKECFGAPGPNAHAHMIGQLEQHLQQDQQTLEGLLNQQKEAAGKLKAEIEKIL